MTTRRSCVFKGYSNLIMKKGNVIVDDYEKTRMARKKLYKNRKEKK